MAISRRFARLARCQPPPDIVVVAMPTPGLAAAAVEYGQQKGVPVVVDMRDMWPDCYVEQAPRGTTALVLLLSRPAARAVRRACSKAAAIFGITRPFVEWGLTYARRPATPLDRDFPLAYSQAEPPSQDIEAARRLWAQRGITERPGQFIASFFGYFGGRYDIDTIIEAAKVLQKDALPVTFVLCGDGQYLQKCRQLAKGVDSVVLPGWVGQAEIWTMARMSSVGLAPYISSTSFRMSIPNKVIEYWSGGLPVVNSLDGIVADLLARHDCGVTYRLGDPGGLASALRGLYNDPTRLTAMSRNATALFNERFVAEKVYRDMDRHLERIVDDYRSGR
jgi:glycosyltransferase involved in cell wall biosynthesis